MAVSETLEKELNTAIKEKTERKDEKHEAQEEITKQDNQVAEVSPDKETTEEIAEVSEEASSEIRKGEKVETVTEAKAVESSVVRKHEISEYIVSKAMRVGLDTDTILAFPNDVALLKVIDALESKQQGSLKLREERDDDDSELPPLLQLDPEKYEADVIEVYNSLAARSQKQEERYRKQQAELKVLREHHELSKRVNDEIAARDITKWFDEQIAQLGSDFQETLGKGAHNSLSKDSAQYQKRNELADQVAILMAGYRAAGRQPPPRDEIFSTAARLVLASEYEKAHEKRLTGELAKRSTQHINRVSSKQSKDTRPTEEIIAAMLDEKFSLRR